MKESILVSKLSPDEQRKSTCDTDPVKNSRVPESIQVPKVVRIKFWMETSTRCLYGSKNLGIYEDATINDGRLIDKLIG